MAARLATAGTRNLDSSGGCCHSLAAVVMGGVTLAELAKPRAGGARRSGGRAATRRLVVLVLGVIVGGCVEQRLAREFLRADTGLLASPALQVMLCGTGTGLPDARRAGPCVAVIAGGAFFLVGAGPGAWESVDLANLPIADLTGILVTKFLADDVADLDEAVTRSWLAGRVAPLAIYGPPGTARLAHAVQELVGLDATTRLARHDAVVLRPQGALVEVHEFALEDPAALVPVLEVNGLRVSAFSVAREHEPPSVGYRFDYAGRSVVVAGHSKMHPNVGRHAAGVDLLIHEAASPLMLERGIRVMEAVGQWRWARFTREVLGAHATAVEAATVARDAGVQELVLTHLLPAPSNVLLRWAFLRGVRPIFSNTTLGEDGMWFRLDPR